MHESLECHAVVGDPIQSRGTRSSSRHLILICGLLFYWGIVALLVYQCKKANAGQFVYPLDDTYIHLSIAKNFTQYGVWGVTRFSFGASSSSLLWPLMLAGIMKVSGAPAEFAPLMLCIASGSLLLCSVYALARQETVPSVIIAALLFGIIVATPLAPLTVSGMEHVCQALVDLWLLYLVGKSITSRGTMSRASVLSLILFFALTTMVRFEGLFLIAIGAIALWGSRNRSLAILAALAGILPIAIFGLISVRHGSSWLPNSVLLKGRRPDATSLVGIGSSLGLHGLRVLWDKTPWIVGILILSLCVLVFGRHRQSGQAASPKRARAMLAISIVVAFLHLQFAAAGVSFYRYESYLIVLLLFSLALLLSGVNISLSLPRTQDGIFALAATLAVAVVVAFPLGQRAAEAHQRTRIASHNIYEQQYQMARFVGEYYSGSRIALNDIGAVTYFNDIHLLDIYGLNDHELAEQKLRNTYTSQSVADLAQRNRVEIAMIYDSWMAQYGGTPPGWTKVGTWRNDDNFMCGSDTITFYSVAPGAASKLRERLHQFSRKLPESVSFTPF